MINTDKKSTQCVNKIKVTGKSGRKSVDISLRDRIISEVDKDLINGCANITGGGLGVNNNESFEKWLDVIKFNVGYSIDINNFFIPKMIDNKWGRIVHVSSAITTSFNGYSAYASSKCALEGYVKSVSKIVSKDNVIINGIAPGLIDKEEGYFN